MDVLCIIYSTYTIYIYTHYKPSETATETLRKWDWKIKFPELGASIFRGELAVREYPPKYSVFVSGDFYVLP